jgi:hypothetical protein
LTDKCRESGGADIAARRDTVGGTHGGAGRGRKDDRRGRTEDRKGQGAVEFTVQDEDAGQTNLSRREIAERKERIDKARKQWANCKTKMGEELRKLKMESTVEIKVQEREMAEKSRRIEACKEKIRDIEEIQKTGGYEG